MFNKLIISLLLLVSTLFAEIDFQKAMIYKGDINSKTAYDMQKNGTLIIDIRTKREFNTLRAKDSINIPVFYEKNGKREFNRNFPKEIYTTLDGDLNKNVILICRSGSRTKLASNLLAYQGFKNVYNVKDGFQYDWIKVNLPTEK
ncbi:rhodanese-like domain-containing protein [Arcobacter sp. LA11]|uniref:rhodanese-like domain-containing protein n=1 Tax=Arcobacter sp. LA11 TaxID=1898176 RepID=UPI000933BC2E|nr:rhodanese-like domain-containing protein [Arcobacter sp. LA11]